MNEFQLLFYWFILLDMCVFLSCDISLLGIIENIVIYVCVRIKCKWKCEFLLVRWNIVFLWKVYILVGYW